MPSQFCVFVANEFPNIKKIVEFGCGNGRDSNFLGKLGYKLLSIDGSDKAIECALKDNNSNVTYISSFLQNVSIDIIKKFIIDVNELLIYSRFFLHSISEEDELFF